MMQRKFYLYILFGLLLLAACGKKSILTNWFPVFESQYKIPYGTYVYHDQLISNSYAEIIDIKTNTRNFFKKIMQEDSSSTTFISDLVSTKKIVANTSFIYINEENYIDSSLFSLLQRYSENNNDVFVSTTNFTGNFFKKTKLHTAFKKQKNAIYELYEIDSTTKKYIIQFKTNNQFYFDTIPENAKILGSVKIDSIFRPNLIAIYNEDNDGAMLFHASPYPFTNYHLLNKKDYTYGLDVLSYLNKDSVYFWDGYRTRNRYLIGEASGDPFDILDFIWKNPPLKWAFSLFIFAVIAYLIFNYKRIQRPQQIYQKQKNNTLEFINTVAMLFMKDNNMIDLAKYKVNYLLEKIRSNYLIPTNEINEQFIDKLTEKSNVDAVTVRNTVSQISYVKQQTHLSKNEFIYLNKTIELFIIKSKIYDRKK